MNSLMPVHISCWLHDEPVGFQSLLFFQIPCGELDMYKLVYSSIWENTHKKFLLNLLTV